MDAISRESTLRSELPLPIEPESIEVADATGAPMVEEAAVRDDLLRLVLLCCHPALEQEAQSAITLTAPVDPRSTSQSRGRGTISGAGI